MAKLPLNTIGSRYGSVDALNANFDAIEEALNNTLSRDGTAPNAMEAPLDMNGNAILNASTVNTSALIIGGKSIEPGSAITTTTIQIFEFVASAGQTTFSVAPLLPSSANVVVEVNGVVLPPSSVSTSGSSVVIPALSANDEVVIRAFTRDVGAANPTTSDNVSFIQTGAGAQSRTVEAKLRELVVSVKDFGAVGNGSTNDTAAIQNAISAVEALGGGVVYFPQGTYVVTSTLQCNNSVIVLKGAGQRATILQVSHTSGPAIQIKWYYSGVEDMQIQGSSARLAATSGNNSGVFFPTDPLLAQSRFVNWVRRCIINNHGGQGVYVTGQGAQLDGLRILDIGAHGIYFDNFDADPNLQAGFSEVSNTQIVRCTGHAVAAGINKNAFRLVLDNVDCFDVALTAGVRQSLHAIHLRAENVIVRSCGIGGFQSSPQTPVVGAVYVDGRYPLIYGNRFIDVTGPAITMGAGSDGYDIRANFITGVAQPSLDPAVEVVSGCVGGKVSWGFPASVTNVATLNAVNSGNVSEIYGIPMQGYRSNIGRSSVADDTVKSWTFRGESGVVWGTALIAVGSSVAESFLVAFRAGDASAFCTLLSAASNVNTTTGPLAGTTGTDAKLTVSVSTSGTPTLYVENRRGASIDVMPTFLSIGRGELGGVS